jgi:rhodanese-related sulfurtransferase
VDVRDEVAFKSGHIPGAMHVPAKDVAGQATSIRRAAGPRLVVTYCSCAAEQSAAEAGLTLFQHGVTRVAALVGGYPEWIHGGGPAETAPPYRNENSLPPPPPPLRALRVFVRVIVLDIFVWRRFLRRAPVSVSTKAITWRGTDARHARD